MEKLGDMYRRIDEHHKKYSIYLGDRGKYGVRHQPEQGYKGKGFLGIIKGSDGKDMTEYTVGVNINGRKVDVPTLVPTLTREEVEKIQNYQIDENIQKKARKHALDRLKQGRSIYADEGEVYGISE